MADTTAGTAGTITFGDLTVNRLGLGTNRVTDTPENRQLLQVAVDLGVNFIDTAFRYAGGASETTIGNTLAPYGNGLVIATKGGLADGPDGRPENLRANLETSLKRLKTDSIELYQLHRVDPNVPLEDSVGELKRMQDEGKIRHIGLSEVDVDQLQRAQKIAAIVSVQNEYNVMVRKYEDLVDYCEAQGIAFIPWFPLGGLSGGAEKVEALLQDMAAKYDATAQQIALAWLLKRSPVMLPIPGTLSVDHLKSNLASAGIRLSDEDYAQLTTT
ncbi:MAG: aldo/keto reductase [Candidatus Saccharibacteria bacterium]